MDILIRGISDAAVKRLDSEAADLGLSRNEYLRRKIEDTVEPESRRKITAEDWARTARVHADLSDEDVMRAAWQ
nr:Antitoxin VapB2 [Streptococcus thermophilus]